jgi:hypothetical protein
VHGSIRLATLGREGRGRAPHHTPLFFRVASEVLADEAILDQAGEDVKRGRGFGVACVGGPQVGRGGRVVERTDARVSICRPFVAMLGDKPWDEGRQDGTNVNVSRYRTDTTRTVRDTLARLLAVSYTGSRSLATSCDSGD